ncbi:E3 SUMO-protein ligase KIAA1586-like [Pseudophryne corroboree]|uniref:E3 SUMO-protein ligase KIAA1586-like n=1 Tax=Pseudophryne corroboree TaxID=495146 RepID=UPI0030820130
MSNKKRTNSSKPGIMFYFHHQPKKGKTDIPLQTQNLALDNEIVTIDCEEVVAETSAESHDKSTDEKQYPAVWSKEQFDEFKKKHEWLFASRGKLGCTICAEVSNLKIHAARGINIASQWAECNILPFGKTKETELTSLRKKIYIHKNSAAHAEAEKILETARKDILLNINGRSQEAAFEITSRVFRTAYYIAKMNRPFTDHESLIDLQKVNGVQIGRLLHSRMVCGDIIEHISAEMRKKIVSQIITKKTKITILVDEATTLSRKSTLVIFLKSSVDGVMNPVAFPLDLIELENASAESIKQEIMKCLFHHGFTFEVLTEIFVSFCSDGANVMLGVKAGVGKLLQGDFPKLILWHCMNHRLELAVDQALDVTGGTNDFRSFLDTLYTLYSQSPKNVRELSAQANELHVLLKKIGRVFNVRWVASSWRAVNAVWQTYPALAAHFQKASQDQSRDRREQVKFQGLHSKLCSVNFVKNMSIMLDVLTELKNLSELLQDRKMTIPKADNHIKMYVRRIESLKRIPGFHSEQTQNAEEGIMFKNTKLTGIGKSPKIKSSQFIQAVVDNMRCKLFTTTANKATESVAKGRETAYHTLIDSISVLNPESWQTDADNPLFGDQEIRTLCEMLNVSYHETHLGFVEYKCCAGRIVPEKLKKLILAVDTLAASNADCERGFSVMNNIITDKRTALTTRHVSDLLFISIVGPPFTEWNPDTYVKSWLGKGRRAAQSCKGMARQEQARQQDQAYYKQLWKCL